MNAGIGQWFNRTVRLLQQQPEVAAGARSAPKEGALPHSVIHPRRRHLLPGREMPWRWEESPVLDPGDWAAA